MVRLEVAVAVAIILVAALAFFVWKRHRGRRAAFLDFSATPQLTFYASRASIPSQKFEPEWETLKQAANLARLNVSLRQVDVDQVGSPVRAPELRYRSSKGAAEETYRGALSSGALLAYLRGKLAC